MKGYVAEMTVQMCSEKKDSWGTKAAGSIEKNSVALEDQKGGQRPGAQGRPARPWGGLKGRQAGHTDCSTNGRITGIVTPTQPP